MLNIYKIKPKKGKRVLISNKMPQKIIHIDNAVNRGGYLIICSSIESSIPLESVQLDYTFADKHYILTESGRKENRFWSDSFGVAHNYNQLEKRLYSKALSVADEMSKKYHAPIEMGDRVNNPNSK